MMNYKFKMKATAFAVTMALGQQTVHAQVAVTDPGTYTAIGAVVIALGSIGTSIAAYGERIISSIKGAADATATTQSGVGQMIAKAVGTAQAEQAIVQVEQRYRVVSPCAALAPAEGVASAMSSASTGYFGRGGGAGPSRRYASSGGASQTLEQALMIAAGQEPAPAQEFGERLGAHAGCSSFAVGRRADVCKAAFGSAGNPTNLPNADLRAETLVYGPQKSLDPAAQVRRGTIYADADRVGIEAYLRNVSSTGDVRELKPGELNTDPGRAYLGVSQAYQARASLAELPLREHAGRMMPQPATIQALKVLQDAPEMKQYVEGYLRENVGPEWSAKGISQSDMQAIEVGRRYYNPLWKAQLGKSNSEELARQMLEVMAFQLVLSDQAIKRQETANLALGQIALSLNRMEGLPLLKERLASVTGARQ